MPRWAEPPRPTTTPKRRGGCPAPPTSTVSSPIWPPRVRRCSKNSRDEAEARFDAAVAAADRTTDLVAQAWVRLARAEGLDAMGSELAAEAHSAAQARLESIGIPAEGWSVAFRLAGSGRRPRHQRRGRRRAADVARSHGPGDRTLHPAAPWTQPFDRGRPSPKSTGWW